MLPGYPTECLLLLLSWRSGMLNWDSDKIVFSKRSLLEFLKSAGVTVNQNFSEIQKLPKYATFGKFSQAATDAAVADLVEAEIADPTTESAIPPSKSTVPRNAKEDNFRLFGEEYEEQDALSLAPPRDGGEGVDVEIERLERMKVHVEQEQEGGAKIEDVKDDDKEKKDRISNPPPGFKPTRKVTQAPGGKSSVGSILFGGDE
ncbi:hypothetical protein AYX14_00402 [Cryptococcus neoformans]|nr:hypothetical protein AYX15_04580 [Cryptococcus neoformans var. grubii]OWZ74180.1 hypothetical protein AYX14_00402 [Cryptococcus neoformans var. grubii]